MSGDHIVCVERFRSARERRRARLLADVPPPQALTSPLPAAPPLTEQQLAHRARILRHLEAQRRAAV